MKNSALSSRRRPIGRQPEADCDSSLRPPSLPNSRHLQMPLTATPISPPFEKSGGRVLLNTNVLQSLNDEKSTRKGGPTTSSNPSKYTYAKAAAGPRVVGVVGRCQENKEKNTVKFAKIVGNATKSDYDEDNTTTEDQKTTTTIQSRTAASSSASSPGTIMTARRARTLLSALRESSVQTLNGDEEDEFPKEEIQPGAFQVLPGQNPKARVRRTDDYLNSSQHSFTSTVQGITMTDDSEITTAIDSTGYTTISREGDAMLAVVSRFGGGGKVTDEREVISSCTARRLICFAGGVVLLSAAIAVGVVMALTPAEGSPPEQTPQQVVKVTSPPSFSPSPTKLPTASPTTASPTSLSRTRIFIDLVATNNVSSRLDIESQGTPQYRAIRWIANEDPNELDPEDAALTRSIQDRYVAAVLFFSLGIDYASLDTNSIGPWLSELPICDWNNGNDPAPQGISCPSEMGLRIDLQGLGFQGSIPSEIGHLDSLELLALAGNDFQGTSIPSELGRLNNLRKLYLAENGLGGIIPTELGLLASLQRIELSNNQLQGSIPDQLANCSGLQILDLSSNMLHGSIPAVFTSTATPSLQVFSINSNQLTGVMIPTELYSLNQTLVELRLDNNGFSGGISTEIGIFSSLSVLEIGSNSFVGSTIPTEIGHLTQLKSLSSDYNGLTGGIPSELGTLVELTSLHLSGNSLTGTIPTEFAQLSNLNSVFLDANLLSGPIPDLSTWSQANQLKFDNNIQLSGSLEGVCNASPNIVDACADCTSANVSCSCCEERACCF